LGRIEGKPIYERPDISAIAWSGGPFVPLDLIQRLHLDLINAALENLDRLKATLEALRNTAQNDDQEDQSIKDTDGRPTEFGVSKLLAMLDAGQRPSEIARALGVSPAAMIYRRDHYHAEGPPQGR
jgi:hypothetical protein